MLKKIAASTAAITLASLLLTGCGAGKMNTEETCAFINDQVAQRGLQQQADESSAEILSGDMSGYAKVVEDFDAILGEAAAQTKDNKLAEALNAVSAQNQQAASLMADANSSNLMEISQKISELESAEADEATEYLDEACPNMDSFN